jgi:hypothetical protein
MGQYALYTNSVLVEYTDGVDTFRDGSVGSSFITEHLDGGSWDTLESLNDGGLTIFRDGIRNKCYVIDQTLTATGFSGVESTDEGVTGDWINLENLEIE